MRPGISTAKLALQLEIFAKLAVKLAVMLV